MERFSLRYVTGVGSESLLGYRARLLDGDRGTAQTIRLMRQLVDRALSDPGFVRFASDVVRNVPEHDQLGEVTAIFSWVQSNIRYTMDPVSKEKLYPPQELLKIRAGDCDDTSMLMAALCLAIGYPARLITVSASPDAPEQFSHVYCEVELPPGSGRWMALDTARPGAQFGRQPEMYFRKRAWSLVDDSYRDIKGLNGYCETMGALGDDGFDWESLLQQGITETPQIIAAASGNPTSVRLPNGTTVATGSPYSSFMTPYTPGYALPAGGYGGLAVSSSGIFNSPFAWIIGGVLAFALLKR